MASRQDALFREIPQAILDADPTVCFALDAQLRLVYCNPAWDRFALENGGSQLVSEQVIGRSILQGTSTDLTDFYRTLFTKALITQRPISHDFHCSSPEQERLMRMDVKPLRTSPMVLVGCSVRVENPHHGSAPPIERLYRDGSGFLTMCSNCRRSRRVGIKPDTWDWIPAFVEKMPDLVTHGLCTLCLEYYYGPWVPALPVPLQ